MRKFHKNAMLIQFTVGNYLSIREEITLNMIAVNHIKEYSDNNVFTVGKYELLKSAVMYGANASGKSNILKAMGFFRWFVINSSRETQLDDEINVTPFKLNADYGSRPSSFEVSMLIEGVKYRYGCELDRKRVQTEWLLKATKVRETPLFIRDQSKIEIYKEFSEGERLEEKTRDNALFLSVVSQFNGKISGDIVRWFSDFNIISGLADHNYERFTAGLLRDSSKIKDAIIAPLQQADLGIVGVEINEFQITEDMISSTLPSETIKRMKEELVGKTSYNISITHESENNDNNIKFDFDEEESEGTKKFFRLLGPVIDTLVYGKLLIIDELDARLHPLLTQHIVQLFNNKDINTKNAQLIFATHDTNLLSACTFRRDQIWFVEKDRTGGSNLYSLAEYKVRKDASFEKDYIKGRYGAIPFLGDFNKIATLTHGSEAEG